MARLERGQVALEDVDEERVRLIFGDDRHVVTRATLRWLAVVAAPVFLASPSPRMIEDCQPVQTTLNVD